MARQNVDPFAADGDEDNVDREVETFKKEVAKGQQGEESGGGGEEAYERLTPTGYPEGKEFSVDEEEPPPDRESKRRERSGLYAALDGQKEENVRLRERMAAMEARFSQPADSVDSGPDEDPVDAELEGLQQQQEDIHKIWTNQYKEMNEDERSSMKKRARRVDNAIQEKRFGQLAKRAGLQPARSQQQEQQAQLANRLYSEHNDLYGDATARQVLLGNFAKAKYKGEAETMDLHDRVADETREQLGMPLRQQRPGPTDQQRRAYAGSTRGSRGGKSKGMISMRPEFYAMADASLGHIKDPAKRYSAWARIAGKALKESNEA